MMNPAIRQSFGVVLMACLSFTSYSQNFRSFKQNAFTSNHPGLVFRLNGDRTSPHSDSLAATGSFMPSVSAAYYTGNWGIAGEYGSFSSAPHFNTGDYTQNIKSFTTNDIVGTQWKSWFLLFGPSYRTAIAQSCFVFSADLLAGAMKMKSPSFTISDAQDGTVIADYYRRSKTSTASENAVFAVKPSARLDYFPGNGAVGINIHASYLQATGAKEITTYYRDLSKINYDGLSQQEIRAQVQKAQMISSTTKGPAQNFSFGAGISIQIGSGKGITEKGIKRSAANRNNTKPRDHLSGMSTGRRRGGDDTGEEKMAIAENGLSGKPPHKPKSQIIITPEDPSGGTSTERLLPTVNKIAIDEPGQLSSSKNIIHRDLAARNVISGRLYWSGGSDGIITNKNDVSGYGALGTTVVLASREAGSGMATGRKSREAGSGMATGRREYQAFYTDVDVPGNKNTMGSVNSNPMYRQSDSGSNNPLHEGIGGVFVSILNMVSGETVSTTSTEKNGDFFFANVPDGNYKVKISGATSSKKGYDMYAPLAIDLAGTVKTNEEIVQLDLNTYRQDGPVRKATVNTSRSNIKSGSKTIKTFFETGDKPTAGQFARPGNPIGGIIVKGGKNPGGSFRTVETNGNGEFEFGTLEAGNYSIIIDYNLQLEDETSIKAGE